MTVSPSRFQFTDFNPSHFRAEPRRTVIGEWTVEDVSFGAPGTTERPPLVFIGGAFQNAASFLREVRQFFSRRPIIIVDLPGQGQNNQLSERLTFADLADLLGKFLEGRGIDRVVPVGLSYGSGIAYTFAQKFPNRVDRLMLGGTTEQIRERVARALRTSFWYLDQGRDDAFASAVVHHLLNLPHRQVTGVGDRLIQALGAGMLELTDVERLRYRHNSARLFGDRLEGRVSCRTMVFTARYDHFTTPAEGLALANRCAPSEFVYVESGDHLAPITNSKTILSLYDAFLNDRPLAEVPGVRAGSSAVEACKERRTLERRPGRARDVSLRGPNGFETRAKLRDYNAHGCLVELSDVARLAYEEGPVHVSIPAIGANGDAVLLPDALGARAIFLHDAFGTLGAMPVGTVEMAVPADAGGERRVSLAERLAQLPDA